MEKSNEYSFTSSVSKFFHLSDNQFLKNFPAICSPLLIIHIKATYNSHNHKTEFIVITYTERRACLSLCVTSNKLQWHVSCRNWW